jgi:hypothetical protein
MAVMLLMTIPCTVFAAVRYVDGNSSKPTPPYTNWVTAAVTIQQAVDAAVAGDEIVAANGLYATGGRAVGTNLLRQPGCRGQAGDVAQRQRP